MTIDATPSFVTYPGDAASTAFAVPFPFQKASELQRFGVLTLGRESIQRHIAYIRQLGYQSFHAGERPLNISVDEAANDPDVLQKIIDTGRWLVEEDGAEILILGCAGLAAHRKAAQQKIGVPVIDPVEAAVKMAAETLAGQL